ncbi:MAG: ATP-binding protein [Chitinophagales bacterium]
MIINFSIKNFTSIKEEITLSFEASTSDDLEEYYIITPKKDLRLLKLGLIYGPNGSGKSNILKALDFLRNMVLEPLEKKTETFDFQPFLFDKNTPTENSFFTLEFMQNKVKYLYELEFNQNAILNEKLYFYNPNKTTVYKRKTDVHKQLSSIKFGSKIKINKESKATLEANTLWNNTVLGGYLKTNFESNELQEVTNWFSIRLKPLILPHNNLSDSISTAIENGNIDKFNVLQFLKKADFNISDFKIKSLDDNEIKMGDLFSISKSLSIPLNDLIENVRKGEFEIKDIFFQHTVKSDEKDNSYILSYNNESQGTQRYFQFSGLLDLMIRNETIFSIDELESSLHPDLLKHFLLTFLVNAKHSQLIATTHLRELLMEKDIFRNDAIWLTEKQEDGSTDLFSIADFDSSVIGNTSSVYNAYKIGKLGAVPDLGDYYIDLEDGEEKK